MAARRQRRWASRGWARIGAAAGLALANGVLIGPSLRADAAEPCEPRLVSDVNRDGADSHPENLVSVGDVVFFTTSTADRYVTLWRSDGTASGTTSVVELGRDAHPEYVTAVGDRLFFTTGNDQSGRTLWRSDGTQAGTVEVMDLAATETRARAFGAVGEELYFSNFAPETGWELWRSDGTGAGTTLVADLARGAASSFPAVPSVVPSAIVDFHGDAVFVAAATEGASRLWRSDGTAAGTTSLPTSTPSPQLDPTGPLALLDDVLYFSAMNGARRVLWRTDGTSAGTGTVSEAGPANPRELTPLGGSLYFSATDNSTGTELWRTDGTGAGTALVKDLRPEVIDGAPASSNPSALVSLGEQVLFVVEDGLSTELWRSDGTAEGTNPVRDSGAAPWTIGPSSLVTVGDAVLFGAADRASGHELWRTDGSSDGTELLADLNQGTDSAQPHELGRLGDRLVFSSDSGARRGLWSTSGSEGSTEFVAEVRPVEGLVEGAVEWRGSLIFAGNDGVHGDELWLTDGTAEGTGLLKDLHPGAAGALPEGLVAVGGWVYFSADDGAHGLELWRTDGTAAGTTLVRDLRPGRESGLERTRIVGLGHHVVFEGNNGVSGPEPWRSRGTASTTALIKDVAPGSAGSFPGAFLGARGALYFAAETAESGRELWRTDGSGARTRLVADLNEGPTSSSPRPLAEVSGAVLFSALTPETGEELWRTNGTATGTTLLLDAAPGAAWSNSEGLGLVGGELFLRINDGVHGNELWRTDASTAGTLMVADLWSGAGSGLPADGLAVGGELYFVAANGADANGADDRQVWRSGGSEANTEPVARVHPTKSFSFSGLTSLGDDVLFVADDSAHGVEYWAVCSSLAEQAPVTATAQPVLSGTPQVGEELRVTPGSWDPATTAVTYQWLADGEPLPGFTGSSYRVKAPDLGKRISVQVTGSTLGRAPTTLTMAAAGPVISGTFDKLARPSVSGTAVVGRRLTASSGRWAPIPAATRYAWLRNGVLIPGERSRTYVVRARDAEDRIKVRVTVRRPGYDVARATSLAVRVKP